ncbi:unnamed protein product [Sphenostylis stenocarpa]|uniref:Uncharacterized protein n=1 Tax=Sphenostylis stenocarpa TaxID=92480 RepID=A0AA86S7X0_9FABA|nr:unnamed protein product [Sphenostylis stenocarpa]
MCEFLSQFKNIVNELAGVGIRYHLVTMLMQFWKAYHMIMLGNYTSVVSAIEVGLKLLAEVETLLLVHESRANRGANTYVTDKEGNTPVKLASESGCVDNEIISLLTKHRGPTSVHTSTKGSGASGLALLAHVA